MTEHKDQQIARAIINKTINVLPPGTRWMTIMMTIPWPKDPDRVYRTLLKVPETITTEQLDLIEGKICDNTPPKKFRRSK